MSRVIAAAALCAALLIPAQSLAQHDIPDAEEATAPLGEETSARADSPSHDGDEAGAPDHADPAIEVVAASDAHDELTDEEGAAPVPFTRPGADCSTPRKAAITFLVALPEGGIVDEASAVACFDWAGAGVPEARRLELSRQLKSILDIGGYFIDVDAIPDTPEVADVLSVPLIGRLPAVNLVATERGWVFSHDTIRAIPDLYASVVHVDVQEFVDGLPPWMQVNIALADVAVWQLVGLLLALLLGLLVRALVAGLVASQGRRILDHWGLVTDADIMSKAAHPVGTLLMVVALWSLLPLLRFGVRFNQAGMLLLRMVAALAAVMLLYRLVDLGSDIFARRAEKTETKLDDQLVPLVRKTLKVFVTAVGIIFVLQNMDVDVSSLLAGASLGGLAFTLAARDTVANLFGSISIFADNPFQIGDWVVINGSEGVVTEVGMRSTRIRTFYNSIITIPNSVVANAVVDNYSQRDYRRCMVNLELTYDSSPEQVNAFVEGIRAILSNNPRVRKDAYEVHFRNFGESGLEILLYFFFKTDTWTDELVQRQNVFLEIMRLAEELGVSFAFPTRTLHIESSATPRSVSPHQAPADGALKDAVEGFAPGGGLGRPLGPELTHGFFPTTMRGSEADGEGE